MTIRIVLVSTSHPGNIGSTARAMKTMGLDQLYLVNPDLFPDKKANELAAGADDILANAIVVNTLAEAISDCQLVIGTSARPRHIELPGLHPRESALLVNNEYKEREVAFIFGRERTGLTNDELMQCHYHVSIPSHPEFSSLNLAQAVQIIAYELRTATISSFSTPVEGEKKFLKKEFATAYEIEGFYTHLREVLLAIDFLKPSNTTKLFQRVRRLFTRIQLEQVEVRILRGMLSQVQKHLRNQS